MQSTNYEYGSPYLALCQVTFTFIAQLIEKRIDFLLKMLIELI